MEQWPNSPERSRDSWQKLRLLPMPKTRPGRKRRKEYRKRKIGRNARRKKRRTLRRKRRRIKLRS